MSAMVGFWIFTQEQYNFLNGIGFFVENGIDTTKFHEVNGLYYIAEGEIKDSLSEGWDNFFFDTGLFSGLRLLGKIPMLDKPGANTSV